MDLNGNIMATIDMVVGTVLAIAGMVMMYKVVKMMRV